MALSKDEREYLCALIRMDIRKKERGLAKFEPHPGQSEEAFAAVVAHRSQSIDWRRTVLERLSREER